MKGAFRLWQALPRVRPYLRPYRRLGVGSLALTLLAAMAAVAAPWPLAVLVDSALGSEPPPEPIRSLVGDDKMGILLLVVGIGFTLTVGQHAITVVNHFINAKLEQNMVLDLRGDLFAHCQRLSLTFHDASRTGELMSRINYQAAAIGTVVMAIPPLLESGLTVMGMLVIAWLIDWQIALVSLSVVPFLLYSFGLYGTRIVPRLQRVQQLEWQSLSIVHEAMAMLRVIVTFGREGHEHKRFRDQGKTAVDERVSLTVRQTIFTLSVSTITAAGTAVVFIFGGYHVMQGELSGGGFVILLSYIVAIYRPLEAISSTVGSLHEELVQLHSSMELLDTAPEVIEAPDAIDLGKARGAVAFEHVSFSYGGRESTLADITFEAAPGQRIAVVGPTGAGKTTLMSLLIRFYDPKQGRVLLDGIDLRKLKIDSMRAQISVVLQEPLLFSGTIAENIRYGRLDASADEVAAAAQAANAHDFISRLPQGYETEVGERGAQLSGGERQRISVARAFLKDAPILILDEPTSSIDSRTERVILDALEELMIGRTSFVIAHRLSTISHVDKILVVSDGRLVEEGTHEELLDRGGMYRQLHEAQNRPRPRRFARSTPASERPTRNGHDRELDSAELDFIPTAENGHSVTHVEHQPEGGTARNGVDAGQAQSGLSFIDHVARAAADSSQPERARRAALALEMLRSEGSRPEPPRRGTP